MNKILKVGFLVVMLLIPVVIFTFLKIYGTNKFDVEILYQNGVPEEFANDCKIDSGQFYVTTSFVTQGDSKVKVVAFTKDDIDVKFKNIAKRLKDQFGDKIFIHLLSTAYQNEFKEYSITTINETDFNDYVKCNFILHDISKIVLVDSNNRIRGYYNLNLDEIDRLIVEIKIVLENGNS